MNRSGYTTRELIETLRQGTVFTNGHPDYVVTYRIMDEATDMIEHLLNSRQEIIHRFRKNTEEVDWQAHHKMILYLIHRLVGAKVKIEWMPDKGDWPNFKVLDVDMKHESVHLKGVNTEYGTHDGDSLWVGVEEIWSVTPV